MAFVGFSPGLQQRFRDWNLPGHIVREFNARLVHDLAGASPAHLPMGDRGMTYRFSIQDHETPAVYYVFTLRICRNDMDFWIAEIRGVAFNEDNEIIWSDDLL